MNPVRTTVKLTNGTVKLAGTADPTFLAGEGVNDATLSITRTLAGVNVALSTLVFQRTGGYHRFANVRFVADDPGSGGTGGAQGCTINIAMNVTPVNDALVLVSDTLALAPSAGIALDSGSPPSTDTNSVAATLVFGVGDRMNGQFDPSKTGVGDAIRIEPVQIAADPLKFEDANAKREEQVASWTLGDGAA